MKKVLLVQLSLQPPGGANGVGAWILDALKSEHALSVLTWTPVRVAPINRYYGTSLTRSDCTIHQVQPLVRWIIDHSPGPLDFLKFSILLRYCKKMKDAYDVIITANNEADLGRRGIQYIHFPRPYQSALEVELPKWLLLPGLIRAYRRLCIRICRFSFDRMKQNLTLVNSEWTGSFVRQRFGIPTTTLHPPIAGEFPDVSWNDRQNGFVCIGRITPEKELDKVIDIIAGVRALGWDVHLHIVGSSDDARYYRHICTRARENRSWVFLELDLSREELLRLISMHRYGIHGRTEEHFGTAIAELVRGGCLVFVPSSGGQVEIISGAKELLYSSPDDATRMIARVLREPDLQRRLRDAIKTSSALFSTQEFARRLRAIVNGFGNP